MHISFLLHNAYGIGGTIRTTFTLARTLAERHDVEIVSVFRHRDAPVLGAPEGVTMRHLVDLRKKSATYDGEDAEHARPAVVFPRGDSRHKQYSRLTDARIAAHLRTVEADVVVGTRPGLNVHISRQTRRGPVRVGQEHLTLDSHGYRLRREIAHRYTLLDALTTVTRADADDYRSRLKLPGLRIETIPNAVPEPAGPPAGGDLKWVVAAGRLHRVKRYDLLVRAFAQVSAARPDWRLRIYGGGDATGNEQASLRALIDELGLHSQVFLMGSVNPMEAEWPKGSIAAVTSERESFGMTIVEAMRAGLPVVATDCPHGPAEIIEDGADGRLVPVGDPDATAAALLQLIEDDELRHRMGAAALASSARFDPARIAERHESLYTELLARGAQGRGHSALSTALHRTRGSVLDGAYALRYKAADVLRGKRSA
ncbi:glycosyltransferase family 4 protein [Streptomyces fimicarius]|uniref:D-inositol 3-phosphate glycosyltransferase n=1 Tax=Streptomyces caviscabies TaxID=90079 RepID=A0ABW2MGN6_9ACTN|nr:MULTISPECIES: glycosyltransferase family 4 protein [unclassified Streptomyces]MCL6292373.1 glycosyltransferase family 4 protein [Streptomyces sp. 43Y-GA-1]MDX3506741.1 glycosyltransferase family 4 protein [Streptomyces sp. ATCC51928]MDX5525936.1 glycosyltransferase family 4 protein [Streptomyces sp. DE06-01C]QXQ96037.1 glycosyltransferase family 4 protein [Streptomyces sp. WY228]WKN13868.1 glycosyltransferase family 4 protein [Streptomyces sp. JUS-F4]